MHKIHEIFWKSFIRLVDLFILLYHILFIIMSFNDISQNETSAKKDFYIVLCILHRNY